MRRFTWVIAVCFFVFNSLNAQKPVANRTLQLFQGKSPHTYSIFTQSIDTKEELNDVVDNARTFNLRHEGFSQLLDENHGLIKLHLPDPSGILLDLYQVDVYSAGASIISSDGRTFSPNPDYRFYRGMINGNPNSIAIVSYFHSRNMHGCVANPCCDPFHVLRLQHSRNTLEAEQSW